jgi:hypothetical protein
MKTNIIYKLSFITIILLSSACNDTWNLNLPSTKANYDGKGKEPVIRGQIVTAYSMLSSQTIFGENYWGSVGGVDTDESYRANVMTNLTVLNSHNILPSSVQLREFWKVIWQGNESAINALAMLKTVDGMAVEEQNQLKGQAMVLSAFFHFFAAVNFGPVPIKTVATFDMGQNIDIERSSVKDVCQYALDQCREAIPLLRTIDQLKTTAQITKSAAEAFSYRIALYMASHPDVKDVAKYDSVVVWADKFIATGPNKLNTVPLITAKGEVLPAYARLFVRNMQNNQTWNASSDPEGIWDIIFFCKSSTSGVYANLGYYATQRLGRYMGVPCADNMPNSEIGYSDLTYRATNNLYNKYTDFNGGIDYPIGDLRRDWNIPTFCYKYKTNDPKAEGMTTDTLFPYFKLIMPTGATTGVTFTTEASLIPVFNKQSWTSSTLDILASIYIENGGKGYKNAAGLTTFTITIPKMAGTYTMANFPYTKGGVIGYQTISEPNAIFVGYQTIKAINSDDVIITVTDGVITKIAKLTTTSAIMGNNFAKPNVRGIGKWRREFEVNVPPSRERDFTSSNFPLLRYADVLLMAAEAHLYAVQGNQAKGLGYLNMVRRRAYGKNIQVANPVIDFATYDLQKIMDERMRELCFEGTRRADLVRWGAYQGPNNVILQVIDQNPNDPVINYPIVKLGQDYQKYSLLPIPQDEISLGKKMYQNPGW